MADLKSCAIHTITTRAWTLEQCCRSYAEAGFGGVCVWRNALEGLSLAEAGRIVKASGLAVPSLVRGGFFVATDKAKRQNAADENRRCVDEAAAVGAGQIVLVVGAEPGVPLAEARRHVADGLAKLLPYAEQHKVKLGIEPLHPMYAADRSCVNRMAEARRLCEELKSPWLGIAADVYHVWWDPDLKTEIRLAGEQGTLFGFHVCDWRVNTRDLLNDRGLMGEGCIDIPTIRAWVEAAGFRGLNEVEVFSTEKWALDPHEYLRQIAVACRQHV